MANKKIEVSNLRLDQTALKDWADWSALWRYTPHRNTELKPRTERP